MDHRNTEFFQLQGIHHSIFKESEGIPFIKYLTKLRMEYAAIQLYENPSLKITDLAESCGYTNSKHFHFVFKQYFNHTPGEYQKNILVSFDN